MKRLKNIFSRQIIIVILSIIAGSAGIQAQNQQIDSLTFKLNQIENKFEKAKINLRLAKLYETVDIEKGKEFARNSLIYMENDSLQAEASNQLGRLYFFTSQLDSASFYFEKAKQILIQLNDENKVAIINIGIGAIQLKQGNYNETIKTLTESAAYFEKTGDDLNAAKCYSNISSALAELGNYGKAIDYNEKALLIFNQQKLTQFQLITLPNLAAQQFKIGDTVNAVSNNLKAEKLALQLNNKRSLSIIYNNLGSIFLDSDPEKAKTYLEKTITIKNEINLKTGIEVALGNLGYLCMKNGDYKKAAEYYTRVAQLVNGKQLVFACNQLSECYKNLNNIEKAFEFSEKSRILNDSILNAENQKVFNEIQTKYETEKKEKEILELRTANLQVDVKRIRNKNLMFGSFAILLVTIIMVVFLLKNAKKKQLLIHQNIKIKEQEFAQQLKIQELAGIDAILEAQEKEQIRIADDLHDNLGSKIATLKLYIDDISPKITSNKNEELLEKIKLLAEETYREVRKIAHNKNFGVLINKGLIPSIKLVANEISGTDRLKIEVININVKKHIKNNIEIQVFRIIQELLTNILKHARASEVVIQFSEENDILNILVEDNGIGFNIETPSAGIGITNIEKRIEKLNGEVVFDTTPGNGTTVILNIPL